MNGPDTAGPSPSRAAEEAAASSDSGFVVVRG